MTADEAMKEGKRLEEDATYSAKGHFNASSYWRSVHFILGLPAAILAGSSGVAALADNTAGPNYWTAGMAASSAFLTALLAFVGPQQRSEAHFAAAIQYNAFRREVRIFRVIELPNLAAADQVNRLKELVTAYAQLSGRSPHIPMLAYLLGRWQIEKDEQTTYGVDNENTYSQR